MQNISQSGFLCNKASRPFRHPGGPLARSFTEEAHPSTARREMVPVRVHGGLMTNCNGI
jgi:hypothetical protein